MTCLRLIHHPYDGLCWALCKRGSWKPLMVFSSLEDARESM